jgi:hypothetical protein
MITLHITYSTGLPICIMVIAPCHRKEIFLNCMVTRAVMMEPTELARHSQSSILVGKIAFHEIKWTAPNEQPSRHTNGHHLVMYRESSHSVTTLVSIGSEPPLLTPGRSPSSIMAKAWALVIPTYSGIYSFVSTDAPYGFPSNDFSSCVALPSIITADASPLTSGDRLSRSDMLSRNSLSV